nr:hypothetical protein [Tanacetum cinerariifolium]
MLSVDTKIRTLHKEINTVNLIVGADPTIGLWHEKDLHPELPSPEERIVDFPKGLVEEISAMGPRVIKKHRKRGNDGVDANAPPKVLRKDHDDSRPTQSIVRGKSFASIRLEMGSTFPVPTSQETPADVSDPDPLSFVNPQSFKGDVIAGDPESLNTSFASMVGSPEIIYQPKACQGVGKPPRSVYRPPNLEAIEAYDPEADTKYVEALHALRDLKYLMVDQLESLKDTLIDMIMASLHVESDSREDALQWICELRPSSSKLKIPVYPEVHDLKDPWSFKEEILLEDSIAANVSHAEKKKKCQVVCRAHGVNSVHHARSDGVPMSVPTITPQGLTILLVDAATQTQTSENEASPRLLRSKSLPAMYNLDWL